MLHIYDAKEALHTSTTKQINKIIKTDRHEDIKPQPMPLN